MKYYLNTNDAPCTICAKKIKISFIYPDFKEKIICVNCKNILILQYDSNERFKEEIQKNLGAVKINKNIASFIIEI